MSELHLYMDLTYHALLGDAKVYQSCDGLYVMYKGLPVMCKGSTCHVP